MPENAKFNNKVDIFALGCILYEVSTGVKLFTSDFAIHDYSSLPHRPIHFPVPCISPYPTPKNLKTTVDDLVDLLFAMLDLEPLSRPRAEHLAFIWVTAILQSEPNYCPRSNPYLTSIGEVERLSEKLEQFGEDWDSIGREIPSRTVQQIRKCVAAWNAFQECYSTESPLSIWPAEQVLPPYRITWDGFSGSSEPALACFLAVLCTLGVNMSSTDFNQLPRSTQVQIAKRVELFVQQSEVFISDHPIVVQDVVRMASIEAQAIFRSDSVILAGDSFARFIYSSKND